MKIDFLYLKEIQLVLFGKDDECDFSLEYLRKL